MKRILLVMGFPALVLAAEEKAPSIERLDPRLDGLIAPDAAVEVVATGFQWAEGPVWDEMGGELLFSDIPHNVVHAWHPEKGLREFMKPSGYTGVASYGREPGANGLAFDGEGRLLMAEHGDRRVSAMTRDGGKVTLADRFEGKRLNSPNDVAVHPDGAVYFTDPIYGLPGQENDPRRELDFCGVFRVDAEGPVTLVTKELERPNGLAFSPDGKTLYVANSHGPKPHLYAFPVEEDGGVGEMRLFFDASGLSGRGVPDGLKTDAAGNVWTTGPGGLLVLSPEGELLGRVLTHRATANVGFGGPGGKWVFLTADDRLIRFPRL